jgi:hypothetical protein
MSLNLMHKLLNWLDAVQPNRWESYLATSSDVTQVEQRIRECERGPSPF